MFVTSAKDMLAMMFDLVRYSIKLTEPSWSEVQSCRNSAVSWKKVTLHSLRSTFEVFRLLPLLRSADGTDQGWTEQRNDRACDHKRWNDKSIGLKHTMQLQMLQMQIMQVLWWVLWWVHGWNHMDVAIQELVRPDLPGSSGQARYKMLGIARQWPCHVHVCCWYLLIVTTCVSRIHQMSHVNQLAHNERWSTLWQARVDDEQW